MKKCKKCFQEKELSEFYNNKTLKDGKSSSCKECAKLYKKEYYKNNKENCISLTIKWQKENVERAKEMHKKGTKNYYKNHTQECLERMKNWRKKTKNKINE